MRSKLRYAAIAAGILLAFLVVLPFFISANSFRPVIEQQLSRALGRKVNVGNLQFSPFFGSLAAESLSISDDPSFSNSPFLTARLLRIGVELWPLITSKSVMITGLTIHTPEIFLLRNRQGKWSFSTLANGSHSDQATAKNVSGVAREVKVAKLKIEKGRIIISSTTSDKKSIYDNVNVEASDVSIVSQFPILFTAGLPGGGTFRAEGKIGPLNQADVSLSPFNLKVSINGLDLAKTGFVESNSGLAGIADVSNTLQSQNRLARALGSVRIDKLKLVKHGAPSGVPINVDLNINYDLRKSLGILNQGTVKIGKAVSNLTGTFDWSGESPVLDMKLNGQNLPVNDVQAAIPAFGIVLPQGSSLKTGSLSLSLNFKGPVDRLVTTGTFGLFNATLAGFDMGSKMAALSAFSGVKSGAGDTSIQKLTTTARIAPEGIQASNLELLMPAIGQLNGGGTVSPGGALNFKMTAVLSSQSGIASTLGGLTGRTMAKNARIPFLIQGTTSDPKFVPDVGGMVGDQVQSELGNALENSPQTKGLTDILGGFMGGKKQKGK